MTVERSAGIPSLALDAFARIHAARGGQLMWFLGAGASVSAGVPTAGQLIWRFKRLLYATATSTPLVGIDVADPAVRQRLQRYFDELGTLPPVGSAEEYAGYFEAAYPHEADRRHFLDELIAAARPAYGQLALAALLQEHHVPVVWTTNFDRTIEDAVAELAGTTTALTVAHLSDPAIAGRALAESRFPLLAKLHGDYQSENLKNIPAELQAQDAEFREALRVASSRFGIVVAGYSGRDNSVMEALTQAIAFGSAYPAGLFWLHRDSEPPQGPAADLMTKAAESGAEVTWVRAGTFDETLGEVLIPFELPAATQLRLDRARPPARAAPFPLSPVGTAWPVLRLNALRVLAHPVSCRRVECQIGGTGEVRRAVIEADGGVLALRRRDGVVGFGPDREFRRIFDPYRITTFDAAPLVPRPGSSTDVGLLYEAIAGALARERRLMQRRSRGRHILTIEPAVAAEPALGALRSVASSLTGTIPGTQLAWAEGVDLQLEWHNSQPWLVFDPIVWAELPSDEVQRNTRMVWLKNRTAPRYNRAWNALFEAWSAILAGTGPITLFGLPESDGLDAAFEIEAITAYSRSLA